MYANSKKKKKGGGKGGSVCVASVELLTHNDDSWITNAWISLCYLIAVTDITCMTSLTRLCEEGLLNVCRCIGLTAILKLMIVAQLGSSQALVYLLHLQTTPTLPMAAMLLVSQHEQLCCLYQMSCELL